MPSNTYIPYGHALAIKKQSVLLFTEFREKSFWKPLTGKGTLRSGVPNPIREILDLQTESGLSVTVDLLSELTNVSGIYNRDVAEGKGKKIEGYNQEFKIGRVRQVVDIGSQMDQKATVHDMRSFGRGTLGRWFTRWEDQYTTFMFTGICHNQTTATAVGGTGNANVDALLPASELAWWIAGTDFAGNTIQKPFTGTYGSASAWTSDVLTPPTCGSGGALDTAMDSSDVASLEWLEYLGRQLTDSATPPNPITEMNGKSMWIMLVDSKTMTDLRMSAAGGTSAKKLIDLQTYKNELGPIANRDGFVWGNFIVMEYNRIVRAKGPITSDTTLSYNLILGADAGCAVRCNVPKTGNPMEYVEKAADFDDKPEICAALWGGFNVTYINSKRVGCRLAPTYFSA